MAEEKDILKFEATATAWGLAQIYAEKNDKNGLKLIYPRLRESTLLSLERLKQIIGD
jgi:hypothetical protein